MTQEANNAHDINVDRERAVNGKRNVAVVALRDLCGKVLMVRTVRLPGRWQPIGGGMDPGDRSPSEAAIREVEEEVNIHLADADLVPITQQPYDFGQGTIYFFEASIGSRADHLDLNQREILEFGWFSLDRARELPVFPATKRLLELLS